MVNTNIEVDVKSNIIESETMQAYSLQKISEQHVNM